MAVELHMRPDLPPMSGVAFREMAGPFSVAIDGFVREGPWFDASLPSKCFNHHEGVSRLETRATCAQVMLAVRQGFYRRFRDGDGPRAAVYANDCDEDVCMSWFLLKHHALSAQILNPLLNRLVHMVDLLDTTAGAYPFPEDLPALHGLAWVFEPYRRFRLAGGLSSRSPQAFLSVTTDVEHRISSYIAGRGAEIPLDTRYEVLSHEQGWVHVHEHGTQARIGMFADGVRAFVSSSPYGDRWMHIIGRMSDYIDFPVLDLLAALNEAEGRTHLDDRWGGSETIGGAPRIAGSSLAPREVASVVRQTIARGKS